MWKSCTLWHSLTMIYMLLHQPSTDIEPILKTPNESFSTRSAIIENDNHAVYWHWWWVNALMHHRSWVRQKFNLHELESLGSGDSQVAGEYAHASLCHWAPQFESRAGTAAACAAYTSCSPCSSGVLLVSIPELPSNISDTLYTCAYTCANDSLLLSYLSVISSVVIEYVHKRGFCTLMIHFQVWGISQECKTPRSGGGLCKQRWLRFEELGTFCLTHTRTSSDLSRRKSRQSVRSYYSLPA